MAEAGIWTVTVLQGEERGRGRKEEQREGGGESVKSGEGGKITGQERGGEITVVGFGGRVEGVGVCVRGENLKVEGLERARGEWRRW